MADVFLAEQSYPSTPATGNGILWVDSTDSKVLSLDDAGRVWGRSHNASQAAQSGFSSDTYVTDSHVIVPSCGFQAKTVFIWRISASKTAAGTATPIYSIRIGTDATTSATARLQLTGPAQTAAVDTGILTILVTVRTVSASGTIQGTACWSHDAAATGFANNDAGTVEGTGAAFANTALAGRYVGLSINAGASAAWTITQVIAEAIW